MVRLIENLKDLHLIDRPLHLALGVFDGLHIGHQAVIRSVVEAAKLDGGVAGVLTFDPHPIRILAPKVAPQRILASLNHKQELLGDLDVDVLVVISFTKEFANCEACEFLASLKESAPHLKTLAIGEDWKFGKQRQGNVALLHEFGEKHGIHINATEAVMIDGERVSSTRVRQAIRDGNMAAAHAMLGREYTVLGTVVEGRQLGRTIGFPTANLRVHNEQLPTDGVWAVEATLENGEIVCGAGNLGVRPTVEGEGARRMLEVHLLDYSGDLYGRDMEIRFLHYVRGERKFDSVDALKAQIGDDVAFCRKLCTS